MDGKWLIIFAAIIFLFWGCGGPKLAERFGGPWNAGGPFGGGQGYYGRY